MSSYSVHVLLPPAIEQRLRQWCAGSPGCDWPQWGGHITLIPSFGLTVPVVRLVSALERSVQARRQFGITLDTVRCERHLTKPGLYLVYLTGQNPAVNWELSSLRASVAAALEGIKVDITPSVSRHPFVPHLSLTLGLPEPEARQLAARAERDGLRVQFRVRRLTLVECTFDAGGNPVYCLREFRLKR